MKLIQTIIFLSLSFSVIGQSEMNAIDSLKTDLKEIASSKFLSESEFVFADEVWRGSSHIFCNDYSEDSISMYGLIKRSSKTETGFTGNQVGTVITYGQGTVKGVFAPNDKIIELFYHLEGFSFVKSIPIGANITQLYKKYSDLVVLYKNIDGELFLIMSTTNFNIRVNSKNEFVSSVRIQRRCN